MLSTRATEDAAWRRSACILVVAAHAIPEIKLDALVGQLDSALAGKPGKNGVKRLILGDTSLESLLAAKAGGDLQGLAAILAEALEDPHEEFGVRYRLTDLKRCMPGRQQVQIVVVKTGNGLGVVPGELLIGYVINPRAHDLADELPTCLTSDGLGDDSNGVLGFDEAEGHRSQPGQVERQTATL